VSYGLLIDDKGGEWPDDSPELARRLGHCNPRSSLAAFGVRERGCIHIRAQAGGARVALKDRGFNLVTFAGGMLQLGRLAPSRILLSVVTGSAPLVRLFADLHDFGNAVEPMAAGHPLELRHPFVAKPRSPRVLNLPSFAAWRPVMEAWRRSRGEFSRETMDRLRGTFPANNTTVLCRLEGESRFVAEECSFDESSTELRGARLVGRELHNLFEPEYGAWCAEAWAGALWRRRVEVATVHARIRWPCGIIVTRYDRALIPWRRGRDQLVMGLALQRGETFPVK
jgi:hypothetical protein